MISISDIKNLHLEITTLCNARCPLCVRNANGYPHNFGYPETSITLDQIKQIFPPEFVAQLRTVDFCGNFGDFIVNPESYEIAKYFLDSNPTLSVYISTNGGARNEHYWQQLGQLGKRAQTSFCIDGLEDTHSIYRVDTRWSTIIRNAKAFIASGGYAIWKMIKFDHNQHQIEACRELSKQLGFDRFDFTDHGRSSGPVFDRQGKLQYLLGDADPQAYYHVDNFIQWYKHNEWLVTNEKEHVECFSKNYRSIYMAANGEIYPCCYLGSYPRTFANGGWYKLGNGQIKDMLADFNNNALEVGLDTAINWFNRIEEAWQYKKYAEGRPALCDAHCGRQYQHWEREQLK